MKINVIATALMGVIIILEPINQKYSIGSIFFFWIAADLDKKFIYTYAAIYLIRRMVIDHPAFYWINIFLFIYFVVKRYCKKIITKNNGSAFDSSGE